MGSRGLDVLKAFKDFFFFSFSYCRLQKMRRSEDSCCSRATKRKAGESREEPGAPAKGRSV